MTAFLVVSTFFVRQYALQGQAAPGFCCEVRGNACTQKSRSECIGVAGSWTPAGQDVCDVVLCNLGSGSPPNTSSAGGANSSKPTTCGFLFSFNEGNGTTITDSSGNGVTGTLDPGLSFANNCPSPPGGPGNTACLQQTANPGGTPPSIPLSSTVAPPTGPFTFGEWINPTSFPTPGPSQSGCSNAYNNLAKDNTFQMTIDSTGHIAVPGANLVTAQPIALNEWSHISYSWDGTAGTIYVDGVAVGSSTTPPTPTAASNAPMGNCYSTGGMYLDESFSYPSALSASQIVQMSNGTFPSFPSCNVTGSSSSTNNCGDSIKSPGEACDDGNKVNGDGCSSSCQIEPGWSCGSGSVGGSGASGSGGSGGSGAGGSTSGGTPPPTPPPAPPPATVPACGNGKLDSGEQCDASANTFCPGGNPCGSSCLCSFRGRLPSRP